MTTNIPPDEAVSAETDSAYANDSLRNFDQQHQITDKDGEFIVPSFIQKSTSSPLPDAEADTVEKKPVSRLRVENDTKKSPTPDPQDNAQVQPEEAKPSVAASEPNGQKAASQPAPNNSPRRDDMHEASKPQRESKQKLGIIGGKGSGKSYLFQAMVYRTYAKKQAGALAYYLDGCEGDVHLYSSPVHRRDLEKAVETAEFVNEYENCYRLGSTLFDDQRWYRLTLPYRTGLLGTQRRELEVEFFDGCGEALLEDRDMGTEKQQLWKAAYLDATTMIFILPLWIAFPRKNLSSEDFEFRDRQLKGFRAVIENYHELRRLYKAQHPVRSILALSMADDPRTSLTGILDRWITPYMDKPGFYLNKLRKGQGVARYLANARKVSAFLHHEFEYHNDPLMAGIPDRLEFKAGKVWMIPLSAIEGKLLDIKLAYPQQRLDKPVPVHVELPLLVALCEHENALM
ncbi:hypothetical protein [Methylovulum psychrotolerans]|uniref:Uncharacterized protein n=1 Tax=Methylovulum psychrotolerans TaxID=1704499 RepID=A0A1Z4C4C9_9GAMM|nr:hypothetical protein [Methylovulum psychrotolerans]ASF48358.1 hypothetical protein CEK71_21105 [Methylovulum psychrotolerans]